MESQFNGEIPPSYKAPPPSYEDSLPTHGTIPKMYNLENAASDLAKAFDKADLNGDGKLDAAEISRLCDMSNIQRASKQQRAKARLDANGDGKIDRKEFQRVFVHEKMMHPDMEVFELVTVAADGKLHSKNECSVFKCLSLIPGLSFFIWCFAHTEGCCCDGDNEISRGHPILASTIMQDEDAVHSEMEKKKKQSDVNFTWRAHCGHYEQRTVTDSEGNSTTEQVWVTRCTHEHTGTYEATDCSPQLIVEAPKDFTVVHRDVDFEFDREEYSKQYKAWCVAHKHDSNQNNEEFVYVEGLPDNLVVQWNSSIERGWWVSPGMRWFCAFICLHGWYDCYVHAKYGDVHNQKFTFIKQFEVKEKTDLEAHEV